MSAINQREKDITFKVLFVLGSYDDWLSKSDICLLADQSQNASYVWGIIDALIATSYIMLGVEVSDNRYRMCRLTPKGRQWLDAETDYIPF